MKKYEKYILNLIIIDGSHFFQKADLYDLGFAYHVIGRLQNN